MNLGVEVDKKNYEFFESILILKCKTKGLFGGRKRIRRKRNKKKGGLSGRND